MRFPFPKSLAAVSLVAAGVFAAAVGVSPAAAQAYKVTNILSDGSVPAAATDAGFINPWAVSTSGTWWISAQGTGQNFVLPATGILNFKVVVPAASGSTTATGLPAGSVTTGGAVGMVLTNGTKASFIFSTLDGTISGWNSKLGTGGAIAQIMVNNTTGGASYPGLAILNIATAGVTSASYILAPNFGTGNKIEVYDSTFALTHLTGTFTDPTLPAGYSPFGIHVIGTKVYVTYALRSATAPFHTIDAAGNGLVDVFDNAGNFVSRLATGGNLNSPWGVAIAPATFGIYSNDVLIGNFGDGKINVYDPNTFAFLGQLVDSTAKPLVYASLWELLPGGTTVTGTTAVSGGDTSTVYFTAGLTGEVHGLFAGITNSVTAGATPSFALSMSDPTLSVTAGNSSTFRLNLAPVNGFSGTVNLSCSGLPAGASCLFSPSSVGVTSTGLSTEVVTVSTTAKVAALRGGNNGGVMAAMLLPFAGLLLFGSRRRLGRNAAALRVLSLVMLALALGAVVGCGNDSVTAATPTPAGTSTMTVTATSGSVTQTSSIALTVK